MNYTHIIWDFNGTLFSDMEAGIKSVNTMLAARSLPIITDIDSYRDVFKFPIIEYYKDLGFDFDKEPFEVLAPIWIDLYNENSKSSTLQEGAVAALEYFKDEGIPQILLSATELEMLRGQIKELGILPYFSEIMGLSNIHAYSKKALAVEWKKRNPDANPLFIGDTIHDADVAEAVGADCVLLSCGHGSIKSLSERSHPICGSLAELIDSLKIS